MAGWRVSAKWKRKRHELLKYTIQEKKRAVRKHASNSCPRRNPHLFEQSKIQMLPVVRKCRGRNQKWPVIKWSNAEYWLYRTVSLGVSVYPITSVDKVYRGFVLLLNRRLRHCISRSNSSDIQTFKFWVVNPYFYPGEASFWGPYIPTKLLPGGVPNISGTVWWNMFQGSKIGFGGTIFQGPFLPQLLQ